MAIDLEKFGEAMADLRNHTKALNKYNGQITRNADSIAKNNIEIARLYEQLTKAIVTDSDTKEMIKSQNDVIMSMKTSLEETANLNEMLKRHDEALFDKKDGIIPWKDRAWGMFKIISIAGGSVLTLIVLVAGYYVNDIKRTIREERSIDIEQLKSEIFTELEDYQFEITQ